MLYFSHRDKHIITQCNFNYSPEGIYHPDRIMQEYDFLYMTNGSWDIIEDDKLYPLHEGELLILEPGLHHFSREKCTPGMRNMFLHCIPLAFDGMEGPDAVPVSKVTDCRRNPKITSLFRSIVETYWNQADCYRSERLGNLFELLLFELADCAGQDKQTDPHVAKILQLFLSENEHFFRAEELAERIGLSSHTLGIRFKKATGTTLYQYQLTQKLNMIHELLPENPSRGLRDIALSFGFYDEFQLSKLYKRQFGYPPSCRRKL